MMNMPPSPLIPPSAVPRAFPPPAQMGGNMPVPSPMRMVYPNPPQAIAPAFSTGMPTPVIRRVLSQPAKVVGGVSAQPI